MVLDGCAFSPWSTETAKFGRRAWGCCQKSGRGLSTRATTEYGLGKIGAAGYIGLA